MSGAAGNLPAMGIIVVAIAGIGWAQSGVHWLFNGSAHPRRVYQDEFDFRMYERDDRLRAEGKMKEPVRYSHVTKQ